MFSCALMKLIFFTTLHETNIILHYKYVDTGILYILRSGADLANKPFVLKPNGLHLIPQPPVGTF